MKAADIRAYASRDWASAVPSGPASPCRLGSRPGLRRDAWWRTFRLRPGAGHRAATSHESDPPRIQLVRGAEGEGATTVASRSSHTAKHGRTAMPSRTSLSRPAWTRAASFSGRPATRAHHRRPFNSSGAVVCVALISTAKSRSPSSMTRSIWCPVRSRQWRILQ